MCVCVCVYIPVGRYSPPVLSIDRQGGREKVNNKKFTHSLGLDISWSLPMNRLGFVSQAHTHYRNTELQLQQEGCRDAERQAVRQMMENRFLFQEQISEFSSEGLAC